MGRSMRIAASAALALGWLWSVTAVAVAVPARAGANDVTPGVTSVVGVVSAPTSAGWVVDRVEVDPLDAATGPLTVPGLGTYPGRLVITRTPGGIGVLNEVSLDDYVQGVSEMPSAWPFEALKAQAIAARTYALWDVRRGRAQVPPIAAYKAAGADICATQACQVYRGLAKTRAPHGERWAAAVAATSNQVLWWRDGPIVAKYSSSNGGRTVDGGRPYLRAVDDPDDAYSPLHRWRATVSLDDLARAFGLARAPTTVERVGDTITMVTIGDDGLASTTSVQVLDFRDRMNDAIAAPAGMPKTVPSPHFALIAIEDGVVLDGRGYGHGIGLSQWGAYGKAGRGMKAPDILAAYYAGIRPSTVPPNQLPGDVTVALDVDRTTALDLGAEAGGRFRLTTANGEVLAHAATGTWRIEPTKDRRLRVVPPPDQVAAVAVEHVATIPAVPRAGARVSVRVRLPAPAMVTATALPPTGDARAIGDARLFAAGEITIKLPPATAPGDYGVEVTTDRGGGRTAVTSLVVPIGAGGGDGEDEAVLAASSSSGSVAGAGPGQRAAATGNRWATAAAVVLLVPIGVAAGRRARAALVHRHPRQLH